MHTTWVVHVHADVCVSNQVTLINFVFTVGRVYPLENCAEMLIKADMPEKARVTSCTQ